jgi:ribosomal protein S27AE
MYCPRCSDEMAIIGPKHRKRYFCENCQIEDEYSVPDEEEE